MQSNQIECPNCHTIINLDAIQEHKFAEELAKREEETKKKAFAWAQSEIEKQKAEALKLEAEKNQKMTMELDMLKKRDEESRKKETEFIREKMLLEQKQKDMELEKQKALIEERKKIEAEMQERAKQQQILDGEKMKLEFDKRMQEKDKQIEQVQKSLEDANRKANQGSMQIQWDIQENALKETLSREFPLDKVDDVPTGVKWADLVHTVRNRLWHDVGVIAWESKNTKAWSDSWVDKLKEDRLRVNASVSIIISSVLPEGIKHFGLYRDIWVVEWAYLIPLTVALREQMIEVDKIRNSLEGKDEKMEVIYNYLTSVEFRDKIQNIVEAFQTMKWDLDREKRAMEKIWSSREKQLERVISNTARLYGDMQGLIGSKLEKVEYLELGSGEE